MQLLKIIGASVALVTALPASATLINFDTLPGGGAIANNTQISNQYASLGVTFAAQYTASQYPPYGDTFTGAPIATIWSDVPGVSPYHSGNFLGSSDADNLLAHYTNLLTISFTDAVNNVSFGAKTFSTQSTFTVTAYDAADNVLQTLAVSAPGSWELATLSASNISKITLVPVMPQFGNGRFPYMGIDNLSFTVAAPVPEPASWAMMIGGFAFAGAAMRRRRATQVAFAA